MTQDWKSNYILEISLFILCSYSAMVLHIVLVPILLIFGVIHSKNIFDILKKMQHICINLEQKNIFIDYKSVTTKCLIFIKVSLSAFVLGVICNVIILFMAKLIAIYISVIALIIKSLELQLVFFLYMLNVLLKALNVHIYNNFQENSLLKEAMRLHFELFSVGKFISQVYRIFIVRLFSMWLATVLVAFTFKEMLSNLSFSYFYSSFVWNVSNIVVLGVIIYFHEACRIEV